MDTTPRPQPRPTPAPAGPADPPPRFRLPRLAVVWSAACAVLALWWLLEPAAYPLAVGPGQEPTSLLMLVPPRAASVGFLVLALTGIPLAVALARVDAGRRGRRAVVVAGGVVAVVLGVLVPDVRLLSLLGYALALAGPPVVVALLVAGARRNPVNLLVLAAIGLAVAVGVWTGHIGDPTLTMLRGVRDGMSRVGVGPLVLAGMVLGGALFGALTLRAGARLRRAAGGAAPGDRLERWGRVATWVAVVCPLPYALLRMTWLTPWPLGAPGGAEALDDGIRVFGLLLGLAAFGGALLTVGLVRPWGEVFPRWLPGLRGRPVPVSAAVVPAGTVSLVLCAAAVSIVLMSRQDGFGWLVLAIPAPVWGPALGLATLAYHRRRTQAVLAADAAGTGDPVDSLHPTATAATAAAGRPAAGR